MSYHELVCDLLPWAVARPAAAVAATISVRTPLSVDCDGVSNYSYLDQCHRLSQCDTATLHVGGRTT